VSLLAAFDEERAIAVIASTSLIPGDVGIARELLRAGRLREFAAGDIIIEQGANDQAIYLILHGKVDVRVNGSKRVKSRGPKEVIGEMALLQPHELRSATCLAETPVVVLQIEADAFRVIADAKPLLWRNLAAGLSDKVREYTRRTRLCNVVPKVFIGSSSEALDVAEAIKRGIASPAVEVSLWKDVFVTGRYTLEVLQKEAEEADFAILVLAPDDVAEIRGLRRSITRDNVLFELGLFINALGRDRAFALSEKAPNLQVLSDMHGVTRLAYDRKRPSHDGAFSRWLARIRMSLPFSRGVLPPTPDEFVGEAVKSLATTIASLGPRSS
jgi:CRP/FNR family cyclic AMP-dependent transcriptional regulator